MGNSISIGRCLKQQGKRPEVGKGMASCQGAEKSLNCLFLTAVGDIGKSNKFGIKGNRVIFPVREEGILLSRFQADPSEPVLALTTRDELVSSAYAVTGARALRQSTRLGLAIHLLGGILGLIIMLALGYLGSTELLTPTNVLLYQLIWAVPGLLVTEWTRVV